MRIGLYGGSFDPPHNGHLLLAQNAMRDLNLDMVIFIPTYQPPKWYKGQLTDYDIRYEMVRRAILSKELFSISDCEKEIYEASPGPSYTINTIKYLKDMFEDDELFLLVGPDCEKTLPKWKDYKIIKQLVTIAIAGKDFVMPFVGIRSSVIREMIKRRKCISFMTPVRVKKYIKRKRLYL